MDSSEWRSTNIDHFKFENTEILNYVYGLELKMSENNEGRGLFATRDIKKGELLIVEKALAHVSEKEFLMNKDSNPIEDFALKLVYLLEFRGIEAVRIGHLYDGTP